MGSLAHGNFSGRSLVVFGAGYVGGAVASCAQTAGATVTAITRNSGDAEMLRAQGVHTVVADLVDGPWQREIAVLPDLVLYCASGGGAGPEGYLHSYLRGMETVLRWLATSGSARTFVYTSSTSVYPQNGGVAVDETAETLAPAETRGGVLVATEQAVLSSPNLYRRAFVLRLAGIYGPQRHALLDEILVGAVSGRPEQRLNLVHRDDIVAAILACFGASDEPRSEIFNVCDGSPTTRGEIVAWVAERLGQPMPVFTGAARGTRRATPLDRVILNGKVRHELGWAPRFPSFREGYAPLLDLIRRPTP